jgi:hypothetical protein
MGRQITPRNASAKRESKITIPQRAHPLAKAVFAEMKRQRVSYLELEMRAGVLVSTFKAWRKNNCPGIPTVDAALGALGWHLLPVPKAETLPEQLRADLEAVAAKHCTSLPVLEFIATAASSEYRHPNDAIHDEVKRLAA